MGQMDCSLRAIYRRLEVAPYRQEAMAEMARELAVVQSLSRLRQMRLMVNPAAAAMAVAAEAVPARALLIRHIRYKAAREGLVAAVVEAESTNLA